jgi:Xaa-Pro aminopeptidase
VGLNVHEQPTLGPRSENVLKPGMVATVEPGVYLPGRFGIRLENMVLVTEDGCETLNRLEDFYEY